ncbi:MAG: DsbA family protein [Myxococcota bacterium]
MHDFQLKNYKNKFFYTIIFFVPLLLAGIISFPAQGVEVKWKLIKGGDVSSLNSSEKKRVKSLLNEINCYWKCSDKLAVCLQKKPKNITARLVSGMVVRLVNKGKSDAYIKKAVLYRAKTMHPFKKYKIKPNLKQCLGKPDKAKIVISVYSDFQCPYCSKILPKIEKIAKKDKNIALCFKNFPTMAHGDNSVSSSSAAVAASLQGKFWKMHDILYENRKNQSRSSILGFARKIGLNIKKFKEDWNSRKVRRIVAKEKQEGLKYKVKGTPTIFLNGKKYHGKKSEIEIKSRLQEEFHLTN